MRKLTIENLKRAGYYLKRNGLRDTYLAALERLRAGAEEEYRYGPPPADELRRQRERVWRHPVKFSLLVPAYRTPEGILREMIRSVLEQTYSNLELMIGDASGDNSVRNVAESYGDSRVVYVPLPENGGISRNTNAVLERAGGDYIGLLDHDDVLAPDALYEMASALEDASLRGRRVRLLYSDEDKCDEEGKNFYEPHRKQGFNLDLILSNNYICHFLVMEAELMKGLGFRKEYDGAQDFDIVLRAAARLLEEGGAGPEGTALLREAVAHVPKVLYHWRCHSGSTASNPGSKAYAYEAGGRAVAGFLETMGWGGRVEALKHLGFYRVEYGGELWEARPDIGVVGGRILGGGNKITGGIYDGEGICPYAGLRDGFGGPMHRASLQQDARAVDIRLMRVRPELEGLYKEVTGRPLGSFDAAGLSAGDAAALSMELCGRVWREGYRVLWEPSWSLRMPERKKR